MSKNQDQPCQSENAGKEEKEEKGRKEVRKHNIISMDRIQRPGLDSFLRGDLCIKKNATANKQ